MKSLVIAVDFDGTCVEHDYPAIGLDVEGAVSTLRDINKCGHRIVLYTMRSGAKLDAALRWFKRHEIELWSINENPEQAEWTESVKVYADYYIDDCAVGCPIKFIDGARRPVVDWAKVREFLEYHRVL